MSNKDKKNDRIGLASSIGLHVALLLLFFFLLAWKRPIPPGEHIKGIEINFGTSNTGSKQKQSKTAPSDAKAEDAKPDDPSPQQVENKVSAQTEVHENVQQINDVVVSKVESPHKVEEKKSAKVEPKPVTEEKKVEKKVEEPVKNAKDGGKGEQGTTDAAANNNGDKNKMGDQGDPRGKPDAKNLYGEPGGGGGDELSLAGWEVDFKPEKDNYKETGKIVFEIRVNAEGELIYINPIQKTVSPAVVKYYQNEIETKWSVTRSRNAGKTPNQTSGTYTVTIRAN
ncbi:MAG: hypothetical protein ACK40G_08190 [Cytophagaceae bacterium]